MMTKDTKETVAERAVAFYHDAKDALNEFLSDKEIRDLLLEMEDLVNDHNAKLDAAMRAIKSDLMRLDQDKLVINGLGAQKRYKRYYDAEFLANALPADQSDEILTERIVYDLDKERLEQLMRQGEIDNEIVEKAYHEDEQNPSNLPGSPKPYSLPGIPVIE
jgi:hypothetical protein